eukprot:TRINITY_DN2255_c0_g1_i1.p2 TRINITY_DN2255_c0_g1~~TRINITY_DN2255_c0_g1_i1.p2  ORF type:complete len:159 (+),score=25.96 TRINITY_DN2255_c0_g1_i1:459-935(+)
MVHSSNVNVTYKATWDVTVRAFWFKFPDPMEPRVNVIILKQDYDEENEILKTTRKFRIKNESPFFVRKIFGLDYVEFIETSEIDLKKKTVKIHGENVSYRKIAATTEDSTYRVDPDDPSLTLFEQTTTIQANTGLFCGIVERYMLKKFLEESAKVCKS